MLPLPGYWQSTFTIWVTFWCCIISEASHSAVHLTKENVGVWHTGSRLTMASNGPTHASSSSSSLLCCFACPSTTQAMALNTSSGQHLASYCSLLQSNPLCTWRDCLDWTNTRVRHGYYGYYMVAMVTCVTMVDGYYGYTWYCDQWGKDCSRTSFVVIRILEIHRLYSTPSNTTDIWTGQNRRYWGGTVLF